MNQKRYYEEVARRTKEGRDQLEEERVSRIVCKKEKEKKLALEKQWERAERYFAYSCKQGVTLLTHKVEVRSSRTLRGS